jgi:WD40 repeat protein
VTASTDGTLILWDLASRQIVRRFKTEGAGALWAVAIGPDGRTALADTGIGIMELWNLETGDNMHSFVLEDAAPGLNVNGIAYLPDGRGAITGSTDGLVRHWDLESGGLSILGRHSDIRTRVEIAPDGHLALTSGMDGVLMLWDLETGELIRRFGTPGQTIFDIEMSAEGLTAFSGSSDTIIVQWRLDNPALDELRAWIQTNRYVRELSCEERELYQIEPLCD